MGWQAEFDLARSLDFWREQLAGIPTVRALPLDGLRLATQNFRAGHHTQRMERQLLAQLRELTQCHDVTLFMLLHSAFAVLLALGSGERDIVIAVPVAGREHSDVEGLIGLLVNIVQLRTGAEPVLAPKTASLQQWAAALAELEHSASLRQELEYWVRQAAAELELAELPVDRVVASAPAVASTAAIVLRLGAADTEQLLRHCSGTYRTHIYELLLAGVCLGVRRWPRIASLRNMVEGRGRGGWMYSVIAPRPWAGSPPASVHEHAPRKPLAERCTCKQPTRVRSVTYHGIAPRPEPPLCGSVDRSAALHSHRVFASPQAAYLA